MGGGDSKKHEGKWSDDDQGDGGVIIRSQGRIVHLILQRQDHLFRYLRSADLQSSRIAAHFHPCERNSNRCTER